MTTPVATTHSARITGPVSYASANGGTACIPLGPCLIERLDGERADVVWGVNGQMAAALPLKDLLAARERGDLVLLG